ncbi:nuclear transport factor 2 family protein [Shewanella mesophila]|uniref:nuclear transport factor 2 family protein n=1 Tax=Shewanella mesophila TaxID=2864208 RepID=UPI001C656FE5|nr:nuclear transport factor 2 family protein [Shewanella mesophila]QYJ84932.1 nuclear transport factor 2 family protein [Shewanella mesophila]
MAQALWLQNFIAVYSELSTDNLMSLEKIYHPDIEFVDPIHRVHGLTALLDYFTHLYQQLLSCDFVIEHVLEGEREAAVYWTMTFCHKRLNGAAPISVQGHSRLHSKDNKVVYHRDYLDVGAMLYEHIPLLGGIVSAIKRRAAK